jgi:hypothetical protein
MAYSKKNRSSRKKGGVKDRDSRRSHRIKNARIESPLRRSARIKRALLRSALRRSARIKRAEIGIDANANLAELPNEDDDDDDDDDDIRNIKHHIYTIAFADDPAHPVDPNVVPPTNPNDKYTIEEKNIVLNGIKIKLQKSINLIDFLLENHVNSPVKEDYIQQLSSEF